MNADLRSGVRTAAVLLVIFAAIAALTLFAASRDRTPSSLVPEGDVGGASTPNATTAFQQAAPIELVDNPGEAASVRLGNSPGGECQALGVATIATPDDLDSAVVKAGGPGNWLRPGVWIGDAASAVEAYKGSWAAQAKRVQTELWVETKQDNETVITKLVALNTSDGTDVWWPSGSVQVDKCRDG